MCYAHMEQRMNTTPNKEITLIAHLAQHNEAQDSSGRCLHEISKMSSLFESLQFDRFC